MLASRGMGSFPWCQLCEDAGGSVSSLSTPVELAGASCNHPSSKEHLTDPELSGGMRAEPSSHVQSTLGRYQ